MEDFDQTRGMWWIFRIANVANVALAAAVSWRVDGPVWACVFLGFGLGFGVWFEYEHWKFKSEMLDDAKARLEAPKTRIE